MTATNEFLPHATGTGANVTSQSSWSGASARSTGFQAGTASSAHANKVLRQATSIASMIGTFMAARGQNALDDGNISALEANFEAALAALIDGRIPAIPAIPAPGRGMILNAGKLEFHPGVYGVADTSHTFAVADVGKLIIIYSPTATTRTQTLPLAADAAGVPMIVYNCTSVHQLLTTAGFFSGVDIPVGTTPSTISIPAGCLAHLMSDGGNWLVTAVNGPRVSSAPGLLVNPVLTVTDNARVIFTADVACPYGADGRAVRHVGVSLSAWTSVVGPGGLDVAGAAAPGSWLYAWIESNGVAPQLILSASPTGPTLTNSYVYRQFVGALRVDSAGHLWRTINVRGRTTVRSGANPAVAPVIAVGPAGSYSGTTMTWSMLSLAAYVPPTARAAVLRPNNYANGSGGAMVYLAPNTSHTTLWGANPPVSSYDSSYDGSSGDVVVDLETAQTAYWYASGSNGRVQLAGWVE